MLQENLIFSTKFFLFFHLLNTSFPSLFFLSFFFITLNYNYNDFIIYLLFLFILGFHNVSITDLRTNHFQPEGNDMYHDPNMEGIDSNMYGIQMVQ